MQKSKTLAGILAGILILTFVYVGNFPVSSDLENEVMDYFGMTVQAATTTGVTLSATINVQLSISVDNASVDFGNLSPGTPIYTSTTVSLNSNNATGYNLKVNRNNAATSTLTLGGSINATNTIPDYTPLWDSTSDGNATATPSSTLSFRVRSTESTAACNSTTWWGTDGGTPLYGGFPISATATSTTFNCAYQSATTTAKHYYRLDAPGSQYAGAYSGGITFTATVNP